jgi:hypothetical protein
MVDPYNRLTTDWVDEYDNDGPGELNFESESVELVMCPCCRDVEVSQEQIDCQLEGEQCSICNFHDWEDLS